MSFRNPPVPWSELERRLSDDPLGRGPWIEPTPGDGGDSPAWSRKRAALRAAAGAWRAAGRLDALRRAALPLQLQLPRRGLATPRSWSRRRPGSGLEALALTDHDGFYGVVRFAEAARALGPAHRVRRRADPGRTACRWASPTRASRTRRSSHLLVLARDPQGYARLARAISRAQLRGGEGRAPHLAGRAGRAAPAPGDHHWLVLTGCRKGAVPARAGRARARPRRPTSWPGWSTPSARDNVAVELWDHGDPLDSARNDALAELAVRAGRRRGGHQQRPLRHARPGAGWPPRWPRCGPGAASTSSTAGCRPAAGAHLRSGAEQARRFARYPGVVERAAELGRACAFDLPLVAPEPAAVPVPADGHDEMSYLRRAHRAGRHRPLRPDPRPAARAGARGVGPDRPRAGRHRAARLPRLLPHRVGHRRVLPASRHLLPGPGLGGQLGGLLRPRHHQRRRGDARPAVRAVPLARARRPARHRHRHRERPPRGGHPVRLRALRPRTTPPRWPTSSPTGPSRRCATWPRRSATPPASRTPGRKQVDRWGPWPRPTAGPSADHDIPADGARPGRCRSSTSPGTSASTRAAW